MPSTAPRVNKPEAGNKYYINISDGGYNGARGNPLRLNKDLTSLPNCVAIYGWFNEIGGQGMQYLKAPWYPYTVINAAKREGLTVTEDPAPGGIMVWTGGKTGEGHVAGVVEVWPDHILTAESEYYGRDWANFYRMKGGGNWRTGCYWMNDKYKYAGCIRNPFMEDDVVTDRKLYNKNTKEVTVVKGIFKDDQNYIRLADLADMGVLDVSYNAEENLAEVGSKCPYQNK